MLFDENKPVYRFFFLAAVPLFMMLSGYVTALSNSKKNDTSLYSLSGIAKKLVRYTIPTIIAFSVFVVLKCLGHEQFSLVDFIKAFVLGSWGPGAYYYALLVQFIFIGPILYFIVKRFRIHGMIFIAFVDFFFELCSAQYGFQANIYRILIFRYLLVIALGILMAMISEISNKVLVAMLATGCVYIILPTVWEYDYHIFTAEGWNRTSMIFGFYLFPMIYMLIYNFGNIEIKNRAGMVLETIGKASYHIMYTQMLYFGFQDAICKYIINFSCFGIIIELMADILITVGSGVLFWLIDDKFITGKAVKKLSSTTIV